MIKLYGWILRQIYGYSYHRTTMVAYSVRLHTLSQYTSISDPSMLIFTLIRTNRPPLLVRNVLSLSNFVPDPTI